MKIMFRRETKKNELIYKMVSTNSVNLTCLL